jgi:hypothetical protein
MKQTDALAIIFAISRVAAKKKQKIHFNSYQNRITMYETRRKKKKE